MLTTGPDAQTASVFYGTAGGTGSTLNGFDSLTGQVTGATANNTLNITDSTGVTATTAYNLPSGLTLNNIQNVVDYTSGNLGTAAANFDVSGLSSVTNLTVNSAGTNAAGDNLKASATANVTDTNTGSGVTLVGGLADTVTAKGTISVTKAAGAVTVSDTDTAGTGTNVTVGSGTTVSVTTTDTGTVTVGGATAAVSPTGAVTVTDTAVTATGGKGGTISVDGGAAVTVTAAGNAVTVGASVAPTGAIAVTQSYAGNANAVNIDGGTTVNVTTTGGTGASAITVGANTAPTGAVTITDTMSGPNADAISVNGGTAVTITTTADSAAFGVGAAATLNTAGTGLSNAASDPTGAVVINNSQAGFTNMGVAQTVYGAGTDTVITNGSTSVTLTGGSNDVITDAQTTAATGGTSVGKAIGTSTLANVTLDGVSGTGTAITSDALASLTVKDISASTTVTVHETPAHTLAVTLQATGTGPTITDGTATAFTVGDSGALASGATSNNVTLAGAKATSLTFNNANALTVGTSTMSGATGAVDTITATGSGSLNLGNVPGWTGHANIASITATAATGAVTAEIDGTVTSFAGGAGNDVVTVTTGISKTIDGGTGTNTLVLNNSAATYNGALTPNAAIFGDVKNFQTLDLASGATGSYNSSGFTALQNDGTGVAVAYTYVAAGTPLTVTATPSGGITYTLATGTSSTNTFGLTVGTPTLAANTSFGTITDNIAGTTAAAPTTVTLTSLGDGSHTNTVALADNATGDMTTLNIAGTQAASVSYAPGTSSAITAITVTNSGAVNVTGVHVSAAGATYTGGAGMLTVNTGTTGNRSSSIDSVIAGSGGVTVTVGQGGSGLAATGSESVNLTASTAVQDTVTVGADTRVSVSGAQVTPSSTTSDILAVTSKTALTNVTTSTATLSTGKYTAANGVITFGTGESSNVTIQLRDAQNIVNVAGANTIAAFVNNGNTYVVAADAGNTELASTTATTAQTVTSSGFMSGDYVTLTINGVATNYTLASADVVSVDTLVSAFNTATSTSDFSNVSGALTLTVGTNGSGSSVTSVSDAVVQLSGVTGVQGFGSTAAGNTILTTGVSNVVHSSTTALAASTSVDETGYSAASWAAAGNVGSVHGTDSFTFANLAASAAITVDATSNTNMGDVVVTQVGAAGTNSLTVNLGSAAHHTTLDTLTVSGDNALVINTVESGASAITSLIDGGTTNTLATVTVTGGYTLDIAAVTDTALTKIDASAATGTFTLGDGTALTQSGLTVLGGTVANTINLAGANDTVKISVGAAGTLLQTIDATGANSSITLTGAGGHFAITATGIGDTIDTSGFTQDANTASTIHGTAATDPIGANDSLTLGAGNATDGVTAILGNSDTVTLGAKGAGAGYVNLNVGKTTTGATSSGSYHLTTIMGAVAGTDNLVFVGTTTSDVFHAGAINVASATSLANALDLASTHAAISGLVATDTYGAVDWFQYGGNTYVIEHVGTADGTGTVPATTGLGASDIVVKLTGLVDLSGGSTTLSGSHTLAL